MQLGDACSANKSLQAQLQDAAKQLAQAKAEYEAQVRLSLQIAGRECVSVSCATESLPQPKHTPHIDPGSATALSAPSQQRQIVGLFASASGGSAHVHKETLGMLWLLLLVFGPSL